MIDIDAIDAENLRCAPGSLSPDLRDMLAKDNAVGRLIQAIRAARDVADLVLDFLDDLDDEQSAAIDKLSEALDAISA